MVQGFLLGIGNLCWISTISSTCATCTVVSYATGQVLESVHCPVCQMGASGKEKKYTHTHTYTHSKSPYYFLRNLLIGSSWGECKWKHLVWKEHIEISFLYYFLVKVTIFFVGIWFDVQFWCVGTLLCWAWHVREHSWLLHVNPDLFHLALLLHGFFVFWLMAKNSFLSCISWLISAGE
jgi:hypothetical protein